MTDLPRNVGHGVAEYDRILRENRRYVEAFDRSALTAAPLSGLAIIACMDARMDVEEALGLRTGDAHIIRNAGGLATDDAIRSLIVSQERLGTSEVLVIGHTGCGLEGADEAGMRQRLEARTGRRLDLAFGAFPDLAASVRAQVEILRSHPWVRPVPIHGLVFDVVLLAGNVPLFTPPGTHRALVAGCARHVARSGVLIAGFQLGRGYETVAYDSDCQAAGLVLGERYSTWAGDPYPPSGAVSDYAVSIHFFADR